MKTLRDQVKIEFYRSSGPGGQRKNKKETAVRLRHLPTGIVATATESRYQARNVESAFERLKEKLARLYAKKKKRIPTRVSRAAKERRLESKKRQSQKKERRRIVDKSAS